MNSEPRPEISRRPSPRKMRYWRLLPLLTATLLSRPACSEEQNVTELSLDDLANAEVISAARKAQPLVDTAAAVYVINRDTIRESRASSIPELLRLVPGVNVSQIDAHQWAVSIRGFNARFSKSLLVMIDGRTIYDHTLSGVFWENLALPLEEVERIEVVRGPGGALWGANAVNGIINIITRRATDTLGALTAVSAGNTVTGSGTARYGAPLGSNAYGRVYVNAVQHDDFDQVDGGSNNDGWRRQTGGLRLDWLVTLTDSLTVQADSFDGRFDQRGTEPSLTAPYLTSIEETTRGHGSNLLTRWSHSSEQFGDWQVQFYHDSNQHREALYALSNRTQDLDVQHHWPLGQNQELTWGFGYRNIENRVSGLSFPGVEPTLSWHNRNLFLSDDIALSDTFRLTLGAKWEDSGLTDAQVLPTVRFNWQPIADWAFWGAYGEAVRTPNRIEINVEWLIAVLPPNLPPLNSPNPIALFLVGNNQLEQEALDATEFGIRWQASSALTLDLAVFQHDYRDVVMTEQSAPRFDPELGLLRLDFGQNNLADATSRGAELALHWLPLEHWSSSLSYSYLDVEVTAPAAQAPSALSMQGSAPRQQVSLFNQLSLTDRWDLSLWLRWRDELTTATSRLDPRTDVDLSLGWQYSEQFKVWLVGRNLGHNSDPDFLGSTTADISRAVLLSIRYDF